jgi:nucleoid-associated protein YgaU
MSRYNKTKVLNNSSEYYRYLRQKRNNVKNIQHYETPILYHPGVIERSLIEATEHIWKSSDRFFKLAHKYYGDSTYWWVIAWYNGAPTEADLAPGDLITIPVDLRQALTILGA